MVKSIQHWVINKNPCYPPYFQHGPTCAAFGRLAIPLAFFSEFPEKPMIVML